MTFVPASKENLPVSRRAASQILFRENRVAAGY
jgi:hypothetical protein